MPKVTDYKAYFKDIAKKAGLEDDAIQKVIGSDEAFKAFTDGFKPLPDYSHDLDDVRNKTKADKDKEYKDWHVKETQKYNEYVAGLDKLNKYEETYGPIDAANPPNPNDRVRGGTQMTQEEIDKLVETKVGATVQTLLETTLSRRDNTMLDLLEVRESHMNRFKKSLDSKAFEAAWKEHPEWGGSLRIAYEKYVEPDVKKATDEEWEAKLKAAREEGIRDGYSRRALPTDTNARTFSPMFDRNEDVAKLDDRGQENHSRTAFFEGLREKQPV